MAAVAETATEWGLRGDELRATVEAAGIAVALRAYHAGSSVPAPHQEHAARDSDDVLREADWLVKVANAYAASPVVRDIAIQVREVAYPERPEPAH